MARSNDLLTALLSYLRGVKGPDSRGWYTAFCPFHDDRKRPNLRLNQHGYRCMACGAKGSLVKLAREAGMVTNQDNSRGCIAGTRDCLERWGGYGS